jgi:hypothetical protein
MGDALGPAPRARGCRWPRCPASAAAPPGAAGAAPRGRAACCTPGAGPPPAPRAAAGRCQPAQVCRPAYWSCRSAGPAARPGVRPAVRAPCPACSSGRGARSRGGRARSAVRRRWPAAPSPRGARPASSPRPSARAGRPGSTARGRAQVGQRGAASARWALCTGSKLPPKSRCVRRQAFGCPVARAQEVAVQPRLGRAGLGLPVVAPLHDRRHRHQDALGAPADCRPNSVPRSNTRLNST